MRPTTAALRRTRRLTLLLVAGVVVALLAAWAIWRSDTRSPDAAAAPDTDSVAAHAPGPPWWYGAADARFTVVLYADLECPYCKGYFPVLSAWIDRHPDVRLQWHHLPLPEHEPAASSLAAIAECFGARDGHDAYWDAIDWIYQHTRGGGRGLPDGLQPPGFDAALRACMDSGRSQAIVRRQADDGMHGGIAATPTLLVRDNVTGRSVLLPGPIEGDALLSAFDLLSEPEPATPVDDTEPLAVDPDVDGLSK